MAKFTIKRKTANSEDWITNCQNRTKSIAITSNPLDSHGEGSSKRACEALGVALALALALIGRQVALAVACWCVACALMTLACPRDVTTRSDYILGVSRRQERSRREEERESEQDSRSARRQPHAVRCASLCVHGQAIGEEALTAVALAQECERRPLARDLWQVWRCRDRAAWKERQQQQWRAGGECNSNRQELRDCRVRGPGRRRERPRPPPRRLDRRTESARATRAFDRQPPLAVARAQTRHQPPLERPWCGRELSLCGCLSTTLSVCVRQDHNDTLPLSLARSMSAGRVTAPRSSRRSLSPRSRRVRLSPPRNRSPPFRGNPRPRYVPSHPIPSHPIPFSSSVVPNGRTE